MRFKVHADVGGQRQSITLSTYAFAELYAKPVANPLVLDSFLNFIGVQDSTDSEDKSDSSRIVEVGGRVCYMSFGSPRPGGIKSYIGNILSSGHGSVLEHPTYVFLIAGVSRSLTHELVRHRAGWGYSQLSQRYVDESMIGFVVPPRLQQGILAAMSLDVAKLTRKELPVRFTPDHNVADDVNRAADGVSVDQMRHGYDWLVRRFDNVAEYTQAADVLAQEMKGTDFESLSKTDKRKIGRQTARNCLPNCTETMLMATANARAVRHFISMRGSRHADEEIRGLANVIAACVKCAAPELVPDLEVTPLLSGPPEVSLKYPKV